MAKIYHKDSNLFDYDDLTQDKYINVDGNIATRTGRFATTTPIGVTGLAIVEVTWTSDAEFGDEIRLMFASKNNNVLIERRTALKSGDTIDVSDADELYLSWYTPNDAFNVSIADVDDISVNSTWENYTPKIMTESNNILNVAIEEGAYNSTTGEKQGSSTAYRTANRTAVTPSTDYCFGVNGVQYAVYVYEYKADGTFIQYSSIAQNAYFTTTAETAYVNFARNISSGSENWQLNEGQTLLAYENPGLIWKEKADKEYTSGEWQ